MKDLSKIKIQTSKGQIEEALNWTFDLYRNSPTSIFNRIISLQQRFQDLKKQELLGIIRHDDYLVHRNRITKDLLIFLDWVSSQEILSPTYPITNIIEDKEKFINNSITNKHLLEDKSIICFGSKICKNYANNTSFHLENVELILKPREITAVIGKNAAGKTTLLQIIAGILAKKSGQLNYPALSDKVDLDWYKIKSQIAYIPQILVEWKGSLKDNLHFIAATKGILGKENDQNVRYILTRLELDDYADRYWNELSGGYKMRFELAKALVWKPQLLVLDEPLAHLDIKAQSQFLHDIKTLCTRGDQSFSVLLSSQHIHEVEQVANRIIFFKNGRVEFNGLKTELAKTHDSHLFEVMFDFKTENDLSQAINTILSRLSEIIKNNLIDSRFERNTLIVKTTKYYSIENFLIDLSYIAAQYPVTYFREISNSAKKYFYE